MFSNLFEGDYYIGLQRIKKFGKTTCLTIECLGLLGAVFVEFSWTTVSPCGAWFRGY